MGCTTGGEGQEAARFGESYNSVTIEDLLDLEFVIKLKLETGNVSFGNFGEESSGWALHIVSYSLVLGIELGQIVWGRES